MGPTRQHQPAPPSAGGVDAREQAWEALPAPRTLNKLLMTVLPEGQRLFLSMEVVSADSVLEPQQLSCRNRGPCGQPWALTQR